MRRTIFNFQFSIFKNSTKSNKNSGFTLIEMLLYIGIFSILIIVLFQLLTSIFDVQLESQSTASVAEDGRFLLNRFAYDIGKANSISFPDSVGSQSSTLGFIVGSTTYTYTLSNGNLMLTNSALGISNQLNSVNTTVSDINFLRLADINNKNDTVSFSFTLTSKAIKRSGAVVENFKTAKGIR